MTIDLSLEDIELTLQLIDTASAKDVLLPHEYIRANAIIRKLRTIVDESKSNASNEEQLELNLN